MWRHGGCRTFHCAASFRRSRSDRRGDETLQIRRNGNAPRLKETEDMKLNVFVAGLCISIAPVASGPAFAQTPTETKVVTIDGEVVRYEAGSVIVIRGADNKETVYTLGPTTVVPADVKIGRRVTLFTEP